MIRTEGPWFKDEAGRTLVLRGVNLGGNCKIPSRPNGATHICEDFYRHREVSFMDRPFPLKEADEHFSRLKSWGFTFLRFLVTWEAVEHAGPGQYDREYLDYLYQVIRKAGEYGIQVFIDPHQDCWSRFSGGDGAPGWTFEAAGMDLTHFADTGSALIYSLCKKPHPCMAWPSNYSKLACATLFTLFFGGNDFAPGLKVEGVSIQEYLQRHYIEAMRQVAIRLKGLENVVGFDSLNEPSDGYIGWKNLEEAGGLVRKGPMPTPLQAMALGAGVPQDVDFWDIHMLFGYQRKGKVRLNPEGLSAWLPGKECIWRENGVWDLDAGGKPRLLKPDYFTRVNGRAVDFGQDYLKPFCERFTRAMEPVWPGAVFFYEAQPQHLMPDWIGECSTQGVNATHWYDAIIMVTKKYWGWFDADYRTLRPVFGKKAVQAMFVDQLTEIRSWGDRSPIPVPTLVGEFGIPYDIDSKAAYRSGDFSKQVKALDAIYRALEASLLSGTQWVYTSDNDNTWGDQWNEEDFSIFSRDQQKDPSDLNAGGRALQAVVRPYPRAVAGVLTRFGFDMESRKFELEYTPDPEIEAPTEIFIPKYQYPQGIRVEAPGMKWEFDLHEQVLKCWGSPGTEKQQVTVCPAG